MSTPFYWDPLQTNILESKTISEPYNYTILYDCAIGLSSVEGGCIFFNPKDPNSMLHIESSYFISCTATTSYGGAISQRSGQFFMTNSVAINCSTTLGQMHGQSYRIFASNAQSTNVYNNNVVFSCGNFQNSYVIALCSGIIKFDFSNVTHNKSFQQSGIHTNTAYGKSTQQYNVMYANEDSGLCYDFHGPNQYAEYINIVNNTVPTGLISARCNGIAIINKSIIKDNKINDGNVFSIPSGCKITVYQTYIDNELNTQNATVKDSSENSNLIRILKSSSICYSHYHVRIYDNLNYAILYVFIVI